MYAATVGRFTTTDPVYIAEDRLTDPQRFNLFVYVRNNPIAFVDPDGERVKVVDKTTDNKGDDELKQRINARTNAPFVVDYDKKNRLTIVDSKGKALEQKELKTLGKTLSGSEKELFNAITDNNSTATINVVRGSDTVDFGAHNKTGENTVDLADLSVLDKSGNVGISATQVIGHEVLEAFASARGDADPHGSANSSFPGLDRTRMTSSIFDSNSIRFTVSEIPIHNSGRVVQVTKQLTNPAPYSLTPQGQIIPRGDVRTGTIIKVTN